MRGAVRLCAFCAASVLALALPSLGSLGCSSCKTTPSPSGGQDGAAGPASSSSLTPAQAAQVLAHVGDRTITVGDFASSLEHMDRFDRLRYQSPERRKELLREMIDVMLLADEAREKGYDKDPATEQEVRQVMRDALLKKTHEDVPAPADVPASEVRAYFDSHKAEFHDPERRRVSAIVLPTAAAAAGALSSLAGSDSTRWGELVRTRSIDALARANVPIDLAGDLGFVSPPGDPRGANTRVPDEVRAAVFGLDPVGAVAPRPVAAGGKFFVVKLAAKTPPHDRTFEEAEHSIRVRLAQDKIHEREEALIDELRKQFPVKIDEKALSQVRVELPAATAGDAGVDAR